jgi:putative photosynthetic complex assembly protein 2
MCAWRRCGEGVTIADAAAPLLFAALVWWFSTGAIFWLERRARATFVWSFAAASVLAGLALVGLFYSAKDASVGSAYLAFSCAVAVWGWHEMSFLMGFIVGPRRLACPPDARGWRRFTLAAATLMHHEIALAATAAAIVALTWGQPNQIGALTFGVLWAMRLSAKFNLFLGAPHTGEDLLPAHLEHLKSYFRHRRMNALLPVSLIGGGALAWTLSAFALAPEAQPFHQAGFLLVTALTALALVEHIFMFVPPPNVLLWGWAAPELSQRSNQSPRSTE